LTITDKFDIGW